MRRLVSLLVVLLIGAGSAAVSAEEPATVSGEMAARDTSARGHVAAPQAASAVPVVERPPASAAQAGEDVISVLVVYTDDARAAEGSGPALRTRVEGYLQVANDASAQSLASTRFTVAATVEVAFDEPKASVDALTNVTIVDGVLDQVPALRSQYQADLVLLVVEHLTDGGGVAWIGPDSTISAAVVERTCGGLCVAHELGHLLGNAHDPSNASTPGHTSYSYGYRVPGVLRTIMAYPCAPDGLAACDVVPYFSNPDLSYGPTPLGTATADNARNMNEVSGIVAGFGNGAPTFDSLALDLEESGDTFVSLGWSAASGDIIGYVVRLADLTGGSWADEVVASESAVISGLTGGRAYSVEVIAWDASGRASLVGPAALFTKGAGPPPSTTTTTTTAPPVGGFTDIAGSAFVSEILWLFDQSITQGCDVDRFCPTDAVTRGQMAAFLRRALGLPIPATDTFIDDDASPFEPDIEAIAAAGITLGCDGASFCPEQPVTREEMAAFLTRGLSLGYVVSDTFGDDDGRLLEPEIEALAAAGVTQGCGGAAFCPTDSVTREQMAAFLFRGLGG